MFNECCGHEMIQIVDEIMEIYLSSNVVIQWTDVCYRFSYNNDKLDLLFV